MNLLLSKIADYLLLKSSYLDNIGLFHGKTGVVLALYVYARKFGDSLLEEYAWDLFQQVYDGIHSDLPIGMENGLVGIAYGITWLKAHEYIDCDLNDILAEIDKTVMERDPRRFSDFSLRSGLEGVVQYIAFRKSINEPLLSFDSQYLSELLFRANRNYFPVDLSDLCDIVCAPSFRIEDYIDKPIGIDQGSAYYILKNVL